MEIRCCHIGKSRDASEYMDSHSTLRPRQLGEDLSHALAYPGLMPLLAKLQAQRRVVIPKEVVDHLGVKEGDVLMFGLRESKRLGGKTATVCAAEVRPKRSPTLPPQAEAPTVSVEE